MEALRREFSRAGVDGSIATADEVGEELLEIASADILRP